jgi:glycosyltransferase involved in cell wall biosynthesis
VGALLFAGIREVRVIDNGSSDRTGVVAKSAGAEVLIEPVAGYGRACWRGLRDLPPWAEWILFCDADGSDDLAELPAFFNAAREADFVLGARQAPADGRNTLTPPQRFGNALSTTLIRVGWGFRYRDLGPFRLIRRRALEDIHMRDRSWGWTLEMQVRAIENRLRIVELPVAALPRREGKSKISGSISGSVRAGAVILSMLARLYLRRG